METQSPDNAPLAKGRGPRLARAAGLLALALGLACFLRNVWALRPLLIDDAYITYRFARRLALEGSLAWNAGLAPVEGYTSFLAILLTLPSQWLGLDPLLFWKGLGIVVTLAAAAACLDGARALLERYWPEAARAGLACWPPALLLCDPLAAVHAMSGMETALFAALLMGLAWGTLRLALAGRARGNAAAALAGGFLLAGMTRPDGVLWSLFAAAGLWWALPPAERRPWLRALGLCFVLPGALYFAGRLLYFGELLPMTFHAKAGSALKGGQGFLLTYFPALHPVTKYLRLQWGGLLTAPAIGLVALGLTLILHRRLDEAAAARPPRAVLALFAASLACLLFYSRVHVFIMGYGYRFFFPFGQVFWLLAPAAALVLAMPQARLAREGLWRRAPLPLLGHGLALLALLACLGWGIFAALRFDFADPRKMLRDDKGRFTLLRMNNRARQMYPEIGDALQTIALRLERRPLLFHHNMGRMMYHASHWNAIDPVGLLDAHIARHGFSIDYVFERDPDALLLPSSSVHHVTEYAYEPVFPDISRALATDPRINRYRPVGVLRRRLVPGTPGGLHLYFKKELLRNEPWIGPLLRANVAMHPPAVDTPPQSSRRQ